MRSVACVGVVALCLVAPGLSSVEARAVPAGARTYQERGDRDRQEERRENRVDRKEAKRQLDAARSILNRIRPSREGVSRESLEQVRAEFSDMSNDFNEANGRSADRERRDWQADYERIQRTLDTLSVGTSGRRGEDRDDRGRRDDLARFRERLDAFYSAAAGHAWRR